MATIAQQAVNRWRNFTAAELPEVPAWVETLGRAGHIAKGIVYAIIGVLAFKLAIGSGGEVTGARGAIREIGEQPYGRMLLGLMAIGLIGYTAWRMVQAFKDTDGEGSETRGLIKRTGFVISGLIYLALGCYAGSQALDWGGGGGSDQTGMLLGSTLGRIALGIIGVIVVLVGGSHLQRAYHARFMTKYAFEKMGEKRRELALHVGRVGLSTKGIAFGIIGWFLIQSAVNGTSSEVSGIEDALAVVAAQAYGKVLLGIAGLGLICYAVHMIMMGLYRRFNVR